MDERRFIASLEGLPESHGRLAGWIRVVGWRSAGAQAAVIPPPSLDDDAGADSLAGVWAWLGNLPGTWPLDRTVERLVRLVRPGGWVALSWSDDSRWHPGLLCEREATNLRGSATDALMLTGIRDITGSPAVDGVGRSTLMGRKMAGERGRISVAVLAYQCRATIAATIDSLLAQTHPDVEILVIDDGSTDGSARLIDRYRDRVRALSHSNWGVARSLNHALAQSTGRYFSWIGGDNLLYPTALEVMGSELDTDPTLGGVYADHDVVGDDGRYMRTERKPAFDLALARERYLMGVVFLARGDSARAVGFDPTLAVAEDDQFWLGLAERQPLVHVPQVLGAYRFHGPMRDPKRARARAEKLAECRRVSVQLRSGERDIVAAPTRIA